MNANQAITELTNAVQAHTNTTQGFLNEADARITESVNNAQSAITIISTDTLKQQVESVSGGRNTVVYDAQNKPNIMCVIPRFNVEDLDLPDLNLGTGTHPAFITNGVPRSEILVGKFALSSTAGGSQTIAGVQPLTSVNYDNAKALCNSKGENWHMMSMHEDSAVALLSLAMNKEPRGNTNYGRSHEAKYETAPRADGRTPGDVSGIGRTVTGIGSASWGHDGTDFGVQDLVGNVWEWRDQLLVKNGQIFITPDNQPELLEENWAGTLAYFDSANANQDGTGSNGTPILSNTVTNMHGAQNDDSYNNPYMHSANWATVAKSAGYTPNELLRRLLIESEVSANANGSLWVRNYGTRLPLRGGNWGNGTSCGLAALSLNYARSDAIGHVGVRAACFV